jgi:predicted transcriptional regulator
LDWGSSAGHRSTVARPKQIDAKPHKTLRRHLPGHGLTLEQYGERYNLKADYPMVAESYSEQRRAMAHKICLGKRVAPQRACAKPRRSKTESSARI